LPECGYQNRTPFGCTDIHEPDDWHRRLLRARHERPRWALPRSVMNSRRLM
jgi:hypothetical protein